MTRTLLNLILLSAPIFAQANFWNTVAEQGERRLPAKTCENPHGCGCFTCDAVVEKDDGTIDVTVGHCKTDTISWICCQGVEDPENAGATCDTFCGASKCTGVGSDEFVVNIPKTATSFEIATHDGKTTGDSWNPDGNYDKGVCGGNGNQGGSCAVDGETSAHCVIDFDVATDCGYIPAAPTTTVAAPTTTEAAPVVVAESVTTTAAATTPEQPDETFTSTSKPGTKGDPHFKTHSGEMYDFHGGCDMVLLDNPEFMDGLGMLVHIRTKIATWWSYVESSVIRVGKDTVEIRGGDHDDWLFVNGVSQEARTDKFTMVNFGADGLFIRYLKSNGNGEVHFHFGPEKIVMKTYKDFVKVEVNAKGSKQFENSLGLLGRFPDGQRVGRDGTTFIEDVNKFGQEWQVQADEPKLFHTYEGDWIVPAGQQCAMPIDTVEKKQLRQRRLSSGMEMDAAEKACSHITDATEHKACVFDVLSTQDINMAAVW